MDLVLVVLGVSSLTMPDVVDATRAAKTPTPLLARASLGRRTKTPAIALVQAGEQKKEKLTKSINFTRPMANGSYKKTSNLMMYFDAYGDVSGFDPNSLPFLHATMYDAVNTNESWAGFPKKQPFTDMGAWQFHFPDIMQTMDYDRDYFIIVETNDLPPNVVSNDVAFELSASGSHELLTKSFAVRQLSFTRKLADIHVLPVANAQLGRTLTVRGWITHELAYLKVRGAIFHRDKPMQPSIPGKLKYQGDHGYWRLDFAIPTTYIEPDDNYTLRISTFGGVAQPAEKTVAIKKKA